MSVCKLRTSTKRSLLEDEHSLASVTVAFEAALDGYVNRTLMLSGAAIRYHGQSSDDTAITSEMKPLYVTVINSTLLELEARFGERCERVYTALTTLSANAPPEPLRWYSLMTEGLVPGIGSQALDFDDKSAEGAKVTRQGGATAPLRENNGSRPGPLPEWKEENERIDGREGTGLVTLANMPQPPVTPRQSSAAHLVGRRVLAAFVGPHRILTTRKHTGESAGSGSLQAQWTTVNGRGTRECVHGDASHPASGRSHARCSGSHGLLRCPSSSTT
ncbi:hypothetical protein LSAT2_028820 [Lamellibrachia satsuma]|nr:hypothetical protein LSAT2_028820 [Lamellibrachia satsuma]